MGLYRTNAIILRTRNIGEADRVLVLLTEDLGKFEAVVKGARRGRSRFVGCTLPFNYIKALLLSGKGMDNLSQAELIHSFSKIREDLIKLAYASFWMELIDGFVQEREEVKEIFRFLLAAFIVLENVSDPKILNLAFEARILNYLGYQPRLDFCTACGKLITGSFLFSIEAGGLICEVCREEYPDLTHISLNVLQLLKKLTETDLRRLNDLMASESEFRIAGKILRGFIEARFDKPLKSRVFLDNILM